MALASVSSGPKGTGRHLLRVAATLPAKSRTRTPIPTVWDWAKVTPSTLTLSHRSIGGCHCTISSWTSLANFKFAIWNSFSKYRAFWKMAEAWGLTLPSLTSFLVVHKHQATVQTNPSSSSSTCCPNLRYHKKSWNCRNSWTPSPTLSKQKPDKSQTSRATTHTQKTWPLVSIASPQASQIEESRTYLWQRLSLAGRISLLALQASDFTLLGTLSLQIVF